MSLIGCPLLDAISQISKYVSKQSNSLSKSVESDIFQIYIHVLCLVSKLIYARKMDSTRGSRTFFDSIFVCQESTLNINLNTPMLMTIDDDIFYDANEVLSPLNRVKADVNKSIERNASKTSQCSHTSKNAYRRSLSSLPDTEYHENSKNRENYAVDSMQCLHNITSPNLSSTQYSNAKKENNKISNHFSLNVFLKRMFDNILGKHTDSAKGSKATSCKSPLGNKIFLNNNFSMTKLSGTCDTNNNLALCQTPNSDKSISSDESIKDPNDNIFTNICSKSISTSFTNRFFPNKLVTILENSNENIINTNIEGSSHCAAKYTGRLTKFLPQNLQAKYCMGKSIYDVTDAEGSKSDTSSNASNNTELSEQILFMTNNIENDNDSENFTPLHGNEMIVNITDISNEDDNTFSDISLETKESDSAMESETHDNSGENQTNSSWTYSELEEFDYSSTFPVTVKIVNTELSVINQSLHEEVDITTDSAIDIEHNEKSVKDTNDSPSKVSPILKKGVKKKRSLSLPGEAADAKNNKMPNKRLSSTSSPLRGRCTSPCIIISPIKSVEYLKTLFTNISNMNKKTMQLSPTVHKFRRPWIPFTTITPPTPK